MKNQNTVTLPNQQSVASRNWNPEVICLTIIFLVVFVLTVGTPDLIDGFVARLMK